MNRNTRFLRSINYFISKLSIYFNNTSYFCEADLFWHFQRLKRNHFIDMIDFVNIIFFRPGLSKFPKFRLQNKQNSKSYFLIEKCVYFNFVCRFQIFYGFSTRLSHSEEPRETTCNNLHYIAI